MVWLAKIFKAVKLSEGSKIKKDTKFKAFNDTMCLKNVFMLMLHEAITTIQKSFVRSKLKAFCRFQSLHFTHLSHKGLIFTAYISTVFLYQCQKQS